MKTIALLFVGALFCSEVDAAQDPVRGHDARLNSVFENVLLLHIDGEVSIAMFFEPDGNVYYVDLHWNLAEIKENYTRTTPWQLRAEELCVVKAADDMPCFRLPQLRLGEVADTTWRVLDSRGKVQDQGAGKLMLMRGRPAASALAGG